LAQEDDMIARIWRATASHEEAGSYQRYFAATVVQHLKSIAGYDGASLLRRKVDGSVELLAVTLWESMDSIRAFAGADPAVAVADDRSSRGGGLRP
jgi:heme-degrading monooxygenase HmoA